MRVKKEQYGTSPIMLARLCVASLEKICYNLVQVFCQ